MLGLEACLYIGICETVIPFKVKQILKLKPNTHFLKKIVLLSGRVYFHLQAMYRVLYTYILIHMYIHVFK